jgi:hypothetical protein
MANKTVTHNGVEVIEGWPERIAEGQTVTTYLIGGKEYSRIRYGEESEDWGAGKQPCHDCAVVKGQFHVLGCDVERCPVCKGQVITCDCPYDADEEQADELSRPS